MPVFFKRKQSRVQPASSEPRREVEQTIIAPADPAFEARVLELGRRYLEHARSGKASILSKGFWSDKLMDWSMKDEDFKVQLFRFVDAFPMLKTPDQVHDHLVE